MNALRMAPCLALPAALSLLGACGQPPAASSPSSAPSDAPAPVSPLATNDEAAAAVGKAPVADVRCSGQSCEVTRVTAEGKAQIEALNPVPRISFRAKTQEDFATIASLTTITNLLVSGEVTDLTPLSGLKQLQSLALVGVKVTSLAPLADHPALKELAITAPYDLNEPPPGDGDDAKEVRYLDTGLDLASAGRLPALRSLSLRGQKVPGTMPFLANFAALKELELHTTKHEKDPALEKLTELESFKSFRVTYSSLSFLARAPRLTQVLLNRAGAKDLAPLASLKKLTRLSLALNPDVTSVKPLSSLSALETLEVNRSPVEDATPLAGLKKLKSLNLSHTKLKSVDPLARLPAVTFLAFVETPVKDVKALKALKTLKLLDVPEEVPQDQLDALKTALPDLKIRRGNRVAPGGG